MGHITTGNGEGKGGLLRHDIMFGIGEIQSTWNGFGSCCSRLGGWRLVVFFPGKGESCRE